MPLPFNLKPKRPMISTGVPQLLQLRVNTVLAKNAKTGLPPSTHPGVTQLNQNVGGSGRIPLALLVIVPRYQARVLVQLRPSVLDPAGEATKGAAIRLCVDGISKLRIGKAVELDIDAPNEEEARRRLELLSDRLLANPVIENWSLELTDS